MINLMRIKYWFLYPILTLLMIGCNNQFDGHLPFTATPTSVFAFGDGGLLSGEPCGPPCFYGITPGKTTDVEVSQVLKNLGGLDKCQFLTFPSTKEEEESGHWQCQGGFGIEIRKDTQIVKSIYFRIEEPIEIQKLIEKYGNPDVIEVLETGFVDAPSVAATVYFMKSKMVFPLPEVEGFNYPISPTTTVNRIVYRDDQSLQRELELWSDITTPWNGYGSYTP
jgi:hypothetical protein